MRTSFPSQWLSRFDQHELVVCSFFNRACRYPGAERFFAIVSRLGNGMIWYTLIAAFPIIYGEESLAAFLDMATVGVAGVIVYKLLKSYTVRSRPFAAHSEIHLGAAPLDEYSFPSGHTLHAVAFTVVATTHYAELAWLLVPFTLLVAASRVMLGLHYPTDVLAGATLGILLAEVTLSL